MPQATSASPPDPSTPALALLLDTAGHERHATQREVAGQVSAGGFFWLDLEAPSDGELAEFCRSLRLPAATIARIAHATSRSSFALDANSILAVLPVAAEAESAVWLESDYVTIVSTEHFLFTVHTAPSARLQHARRQCHDLDENARTGKAGVLFLVLDALFDSFRSQLLALDKRLGDIQLGMHRGTTTPQVHHELMQIHRVLTDGIQHLGWYVLDLEEAAEEVDRLPGKGPGMQQFLDRHRQRVTRLTDNGKEIRGEARDALLHHAGLVAGRQAQVINSLSVVATVFLPLSFLTGYFGMNFRILTSYVQNTLWEFILLGLLLMIASASLSLLLIHRLERRLNVGRIGR